MRGVGEHIIRKQLQAPIFIRRRLLLWSRGIILDSDLNPPGSFLMLLEERELGLVIDRTWSLPSAVPLSDLCEWSLVSMVDRRDRVSLGVTACPS